MVRKGSTSRLEHDPQATFALQYNDRECPSEYVNYNWTSTLGLLMDIWLKQDQNPRRTSEKKKKESCTILFCLFIMLTGFLKPKGGLNFSWIR